MLLEEDFLSSDFAELEEDFCSSLLELDCFAELLDFAELEDTTTELEEATTLELDCFAELLDFAELEDTTTELEEATTLELDCFAELLDFAELEDAITLEDDASFVLLLDSSRLSLLRMTLLEELLNVAELLLDPSLELRMTFCDELLDFAELEEAATLEDDANFVLLLDSSRLSLLRMTLLEELLNVAELLLDPSLELRMTFCDELIVAKLDEDVTDEDEFSSIEATTFTLPVTVFVSP